MKISRRQCVVAPFGLAASSAAPALAKSAPRPSALDGLWGDQGDGTFVNPILPADFSDIDAIRVGDDYYAISSTLHVSPGMVVLHSKDLVNWRVLGHAIPDLGAISPDLTWQKMNGYGRGVWAGALRHHLDRFWIYFASPNDGIFVTTAANAAGPWLPLHQVWATKGYDDTCPFWDEDGQGYLVTTHFELDPVTNRKYNIHLFKLNADGRSLDLASDRILHQSNGSEANKLYKFGSVYYHYYSEVKPEGRVIMMRRAKSLEGPWETRQLNHVDKAIDKEPNQGGLIDTGEGGWWFLSHQGRGDWEGRALVLLPVTWLDGWPVIGEPGDDGIGHMVWQPRKPIAGFPRLQPAQVDDFGAAGLGPQWEWNHQPRPDMWSLTERKGHLRLKAFKPLRENDFLSVGNTVSQRVMRTRANEAVTRIDIGRMADGQQAGLCHVSRRFCCLGLTQVGNRRRLEYVTPSEHLSGPDIASPHIWLRSIWTSVGDSQFSYSLDGQNFVDFGAVYRLEWGHYRGNRIGLYAFNPKGEGGFIDVESFTYRFADQNGRFI